MRFLKTETPDLKADELELLAKTIAEFVDAGGTISLTEWRELEPMEKKMLAEVGRCKEVERAARIGLACQGTNALMEVLAEADGGRAKLEARLQTAALKAGLRLYSETAKDPVRP